MLLLCPDSTADECDSDCHCVFWIDYNVVYAASNDGYTTLVIEFLLLNRSGGFDSFVSMHLLRGTERGDSGAVLAFGDAPTDISNAV